LGVACLVALLFAPTRLRAADTLRITLQEAVDQALQHNFDVQLARQDSLLAVNLGKTSITGYLPKLNAAAGASTGANDINQKLADGRTISQGGATVSNVNANATLSWTVFDGFQMFATADRVHALESQGLSRVRAEMQTVVSDVLTTYNGLVAFQQFLQTVDSALVLAEERYAVQQQRYNIGTTSGVELAQSSIDLNTQRALAIGMRADRDNASSALLTLLGRSSINAVVVADPLLPPLTIPSLQQLRNDVDSLNPEVIEAQHAYEAASAHVTEVQAAYFPQISVSSAYQFNRTSQGAGFILENRTNGWNVGAQLQWNIFNGFADKLARDRAIIEQDRAQIDIEAQRNDLHGQLDRMYRSFQTKAEQLALEQASYAEAQRNATIAVERLRIGTIDALEVRQTLLTLLEVGERVARREYERRLAATELLRLGGRLVR
jgi:outer membrane protein TolC